MKKFILILLFVSVAAGNAFAYWSGSLGAKHEEVAEYLLDYPTIVPYMDELVRYYGIDIDDIIATADSEPDPHHGWGFISSSTNLSNTPVTSYNIGMILHAAADGSVASKHEPSILENDYAHDIWEYTAEFLSLPSLSYSADVLMGAFSAKMDDIYAQQIDLDYRYKDWYEDQIFPTSAPHNQISEGLDNSLQMGEAVLKEFFDDHEILCPSYVVADWRFDEGNGQYAYTSKGKITIDLQLGSSTGTDDSDPEWADGFYRTGAIRTKKYSVNGASNYARTMSDKLTAYECGKLAPSGSYTIEVIFNPSSFPNYSTSDVDHPMCLLKCTDVSDGGKCQYTLSLMNNSSMHRCVRFYANHADGTSTTFVYDIQNAGITITPGKWYYVCVTFDSSNNELTIMVKDMQTAVRYVGVTTSKPLAGWTTTPAPVFMIGSEYTGTGGHCFDGKIDRVRLSNSRLSYARRLYLYPTLAYWKFDENAGQITANTNGATDVNLQFGSTTSVDNSDPTWSTGLNGSCMKGKKYTENNISVYSMNSNWTLKDTELMCPGNSYAIEMIVNPTSWPAYSAFDANHPMGLLRYYDAADGKTRYLIRLLNNSSLKRCVSFSALRNDGTSTSYTFNAQNAGVTITPGNWYYIGVIYNDYPAGAGTLELIVRDMATGYTVSGTTSSKPLMEMSDDPNPEFTVGSEYLSGGRCFDGKIDELRISDAAIADSSRLYGGLKVGDWGFFKADFNSDGYVDYEDLYYIACYWLRTSSSSSEVPITNGLVVQLDTSSVTTTNIGGVDYVTSWNDLSGHSNNALQATSGLQPTLVSNATLTGYSAVKFDGSNDYLSIVPNSTLDGGNWTIFAVCAATAIESGNGTKRFINLGYADIDPSPTQTQVGPTAYSVLFASENSGVRAISRTVANGGIFVASGHPTLAVNTFYVAAATFDSVSTNVGAYLIDAAGNVYSGTGTGSTSVGQGNTVAFIGCGTAGATNAAPDNYFNGSLSEVLVYNRVLDSTEIASVSDYLNTKYVPEPETLENFDTDNIINMKDYAAFMLEWFKCSDPANANCVHVLY